MQSSSCAVETLPLLDSCFQPNKLLGEGASLELRIISSESLFVFISINRSQPELIVCRLSFGNYLITASSDGTL